MKEKFTKPKLKIEPEAVDWLIELIGAIGLALLIGLPIIHYGSLPDLIPSNFGSDGQAVGFAGKKTIWIFPIVGLIMYVGLNLLNRYPHLFNFPVKITLENAPIQYKLATKMLRMLNTIMVCGFCYMAYEIIQIALAKQQGMGNYFTPVFLILIFGSIGYYLYRAIKEK